jgi:HSP20 family protein
MPQKGKQAKRQGKKDTKETQRGKRESRPQQTTSSKSAETGIARREQYSPVRATISPFSLMRRFSDEMDRIFGDFSLGGGFAPDFGRELGRLADLETSTWLPQVEVFERDRKLTIRADLPGLSKDDIDVNITDDGVEIRGERHQEREENDEGYYRSERSYGSFYRKIPLPSGANADEANATFRDGVLEITVPAPERQREPQSRRIEIGRGAQEEEQPRAKAKGAGA